MKRDGEPKSASKGDSFPGRLLLTRNGAGRSSLVSSEEAMIARVVDEGKLPGGDRLTEKGKEALRWRLVEIRRERGVVKKLPLGDLWHRLAPKPRSRA